jgi:flagellar hook-associated protein 1 FlgK
MSLIGSLNTSFAGMQNTEARLNTVSENVTNADKAGYTRKVYETDYATNSGQTSPIGGQVTSALLDPFLQEQVVEDISTAAYDNVTAEYLNEYSDRAGKIESKSSLTNSMNDLSAALDQLSVTPEDASLKSQVVSDGDQLARELSDLSSTIQDLRGRADQGIEDSVNSINQSLEELERLNKDIAIAQATGRSTANLEDERRVELEKLSQQIDVEYFYNSDNQLQIYTSGTPLLTSQAHSVEYTALNNSVTSDVTYPADFSGISVNGRDITNNISGGELGALIELRDTTLVQEQDKLDELALVLTDEMNELSNQSSSLPPRSTITGDQEGIAAGAALGGTGTVRIATVDQNGIAQDVADFNLATYATIGDMITDINATLGPTVTASITADNELQLATDPAFNGGLAINQNDTSIGADADGFGEFFGLNNFYDATGAEDIQISDYLSESSEHLATGSLSMEPGLSTGDAAVNAGDGTISKMMNDAFTANHNFAAAGNFSAQTETLTGYTTKIIADISQSASRALDDAETSSLLLEETQTTLLNLTGVNIDEEMTRLVELQSKYEASATLIATIQELFDQLIAAVR